MSDIVSAPEVARVGSGTRAAGGIALAVAIAHGMNDLYSAFLHPLLPRIMDRLGLSITLAATLAMTLSLAASLIQPVMGHLADRFGRRHFVILGPLLSAVFMSLIGAAPSFGFLIVCLMFGGLGSAAFHPPGASMAARVTDGKGSGRRQAVFSFGGALGYALGPMVAVGLVSFGGLQQLWIAMIPMVLMTPILYMVLPADLPAPRHSQSVQSPVAVLRMLAGPLGLIFGISVLGAFVQRTFLTMQPIAISRSGGSEELGALVLSIYLGAQALGSLGGGLLTDRMDRRMLLILATSLSFPMHALAFWLPPATPLAFVAAACAGFLNMVLLPPIVVMAQELVPAGAALMSGIVMGLAWATGSILVLGAGVIADSLSPQAAGLIASPLMLLGSWFALLLPRVGRGR